MCEGTREERARRKKGDKRGLEKRKDELYTYVLRGLDLNRLVPSFLRPKKSGSRPTTTVQCGPNLFCV